MQLLKTSRPIDFTQPNIILTNPKGGSTAFHYANGEVYFDFGSAIKSIRFFRLMEELS
jgi:hypothetical protein